METTTKISISIEQDWGSNYSAEFRVFECIFSTYDRLIDADIFTATLKDALKRSGGFKMLTIDVTHGNSYDTRRETKASYRFTKDYAGEIKMSVASPQTSWHFQEWHNAVLKDVYKYTRVCIDVANMVYLKSVRESATATI
jgi:hypothetical protein